MAPSDFFAAEHPDEDSEHGFSSLRTLYVVDSEGYSPIIGLRQTAKQEVAIPVDRRARLQPLWLNL